MDNMDEKKLEVFTDKLMSNTILEQPSINFTDNIMFKIEAITTTKGIVYKPLISKTAWLCIGLGFIALTSYFVLKQPVINNSLINSFDLPKVSNPLKSITFNFSKILIYAVVLFAVMFSIQIPLLKHYFNKRIVI